MTFSSLKDLLPKTAGKFQLQGELKAALVINRASSLIKEMLDEGMSSKIRVKRFKDGILWVSVANAALAQKLLMKSYRLIQSINHSLAENIVLELRSFQESHEEEEDLC